MLRKGGLNGETEPVMSVSYYECLEYVTLLL